jgi:hypothetical protein
LSSDPFLPTALLVRALTLGVAAEQSVHYLWDYFSSFLCHILFSQKGLINPKLKTIFGGRKNKAFSCCYNQDLYFIGEIQSKLARKTQVLLSSAQFVLFF